MSICTLIIPEYITQSNIALTDTFSSCVDVIRNTEIDDRRTSSLNLAVCHISAHMGNNLTKEMEKTALLLHLQSTDKYLLPKSTFHV